MNFSIIAAMDSQMGIGKNGKLPWKLSSDLKYFNKVTTGNGHSAVIMGRTTWESLPNAHRPLKDRLNIVLTGKDDFSVPDGVFISKSLDGAFELALQKGIKDVFVIGGANVYSQAIKHPLCSKIILTEINGIFDCDAFFPNIDANRFTKSIETKLQEENGIKFTFCVYDRPS